MPPRKAKQEELPKPPLQLAIPREQARVRLQERIDKAQPLLTPQIQSFEQLDDAERAVSTWSTYNVELLRRLFTSPELAEEYSGWGGGALYMGRDLHREARQCVENVKEKIHRLGSIIERLELIPEAQSISRQGTHAPTREPTSTRRIFLVHGHDEQTRETVARFLEKLGLEAIILHEQASEGRTIIEKLEHHGDVPFAVVLLTPDDVGRAAAAAGPDLPRARQNVVLELGYFVGRLGRSSVCALHKGSLDLPSDYLGVVYVPLDDAGAWRLLLGRELKAANFSIDLNDLA